METKSPVGAPHPPCESAPQNETTHPAVPAAAGVAPTPPPLPGGAVPMGGAYAPPVAPRREVAPFSATRADGLLVIACLVLGYLAMRWVLWGGFAGWGVTAFAVLSAGAVLANAAARKVKPAKTSWFWLAVYLLVGLSYALWPAGLLAPYKGLLLVGAAVYWAGSLFGIQLMKKTSNLLPLDAVNMMFVVPVANLSVTGKSLKAIPGGKGSEKTGRKSAAPVVVGVLCCIPLLAVVLPMLARADSGNFGRLVERAATFFYDILNQIIAFDDVAITLAQIVFGVPVGLWLFSYLAGGAHKRNTGLIDAKKARRSMEALRLVPVVTVLIVLGVACAVYALFIGCQLPYFFSAFRGIKPEQYNAYSEYAREGFFELCRIAAINLGLMAAAGALYKKAVAADAGEAAPKALRGLNVLLSALTILVIVTGFSKMGLYIARQGFTPRRLMTCVFMAFLAGVCGAVIALQFKHFSIVRFAAVWGAGLLCALCLANLDGVVVRYNTAQYLAGNLETHDELIVARGGPAGAVEAMKIYENLDENTDYEQKQRLSWALFRLYREAWMTEGTSRDCLANARAREAIYLPQIEEIPTDADETDRLYLERAREEGGWQWTEWQFGQMAEAEQLFNDHYQQALNRGGYD